MSNSLKYDQLIIYYFSGTGNARNAAMWIIKVAQEKGLKTHLINIDRFEEIEAPTLTNKTIIGFCFPTHGFNLPPLMLKFIRRFPRQNKANVFILNTRGGLKLSKLFLPGVSGIAQLLPALILRLKGYRIVGMQPLDLPSNWLILHPGLKKKVINSIYGRCKNIVNEFTNKLLGGQKKYKALLSTPIDLALLPISLGYYFIGRFFLAKTLIASNDCNNCNVCIKQCPTNAIRTVNKRPFWTYRCESCMRCINLCPQRAIETTHTSSISLVIFFSMVISPLLIAGLKNLGAFDFFYQSRFTREIWGIIDAFFFLGFMILSYGVIHVLMKFKFVNKLVTYTSLSKFKFWRRYKAPKV